MAICGAVNLSLERGNSDGSCYHYVSLGHIAGPRFGDYAAGFRFGRLGYQLVEQRQLKRFQARTYKDFGAHVIPWTRHVRTCRDILRRALEIASQSGDLTFAAYSHVSLNSNLLAAGDALAEVQREVEIGLAFARKVRFQFVMDLVGAQLGLVRTLRGFFALCLGGIGREKEGVVAVHNEPVLVRVHSQCFTGDVFGSTLCDCGAQLHQAMSQIGEHGKGVVLYMRQEGRGIGLLPKLQAYRLQHM